MKPLVSLGKCLNWSVLWSTLFNYLILRVYSGVHFFVGYLNYFSYICREQ